VRADVVAGAGGDAGEDGKPVATIVIPKAALDAKPYKPAVRVKGEPDGEVHFAAEQLQLYVQKITGAQLAIVGDDQAPAGPVVLVGASKRTNSLKLNIPTGLTPERKEEAYMIWAKGDTLVLAGNDMGPYQGTAFAVCEFLNRQGVRWFMPADLGEVPHTPTLEVKDFTYRDKPDFIVRSWNGNLAPELRVDDALFRLHNKLTLSQSDVLAIPGDTSLRKYMPDKELMATHPEYFAQNLDGTRNRTW
jgi:hypothetical protein